MSRLALPLHLLIALALVLNGIGGAMAGVLVPAVPEVAAVGEALRASSPEDCGGHVDRAHQEQAPAPGPGCHSSGDADCGDSLQCLQACLHASVAVAPVFFLGVQTQPADAILHPLAGGHPAPPLPSPIRPPIA